MPERMMSGIIVKTQGVSEAWYNGQRDKVVEAIRAKAEEEKAALLAQMEQMEIDHRVELEIERDRADINTRKRNERNAEKLNAFFASLTKRSGPVRRMFRRVGNAYALVVGTIMCIPEIGQNIGLWEEISKEEYDEICKRKAGAACRQRRKEPRFRTHVY
jgi:hypothetical protein